VVEVEVAIPKTALKTKTLAPAMLPVIHVDFSQTINSK